MYGFAAPAGLGTSTYGGAMASRTPFRVALGVVPALFALSACGGMSAATEDPFQADGRNEIRIHVRNGNFYDARITALLGGESPRQLGSVGGKTEGVFTMPLTFSRDLRLEIDLLAGPTCVTEAIMVDPGDDLQLEILPEPIGASFCR